MTKTEWIELCEDARDKIARAEHFIADEYQAMTLSERQSLLLKIHWLHQFAHKAAMEERHSLSNLFALRERALRVEAQQRFQSVPGLEEFDPSIQQLLSNRFNPNDIVQCLDPIAGLQREGYYLVSTFNPKLMPKIVVSINGQARSFYAKRFKLAVPAGSPDHARWLATPNLVLNARPSTLLCRPSLCRPPRPERPELEVVLPFEEK